MKVLRFLLALFLLVPAATVFAQSDETVTDEELKKYAVLMDSVEDMSKSLIEEITEMVNNNDKLSAARYNELSKIVGDETKLTAAKATPEEIEAVKKVLTKKEEGTAKIQETFQTMATEYVGAAVYNKVKKALASNAELKAKYEALLTELAKDNSE